MSQQINLLNPAFRKAFDWLSATPLAIAACVMLLIILTAFAWASRQADSLEQAANKRADALKTAQDRLLTMTKSMAESKPNQQLANELVSARALLKSREEIFKILEGGEFANTIGFAEFLRGFARQAPNGLWLTGFTIGAGGAEMEIRGRMLDPASLPEYIRRLKTEKVFQGRSFASLTIQRPEEGKEKKLASSPLASAAKPNAPTTASPRALLPSFVDFVLMPSAPNPVIPATTNAPAILPSLVESVLLPNAIAPGKGSTSPITGTAPLPEKKP